MICRHFLAVGNDQMWPVYLLAAFTIAYIVLRPILRKKKDPLEKLPSFGLAQQRGVEREMSNLLVELSDMARQVTAQIETRTAKLDLLIQEADRKIAELKQLTAAKPNTPPAPTAPDPELPPEVDPQHAQVYALADTGHSPAQIAQQLDRPRGEIELILALRPH